MALWNNNAVVNPACGAQHLKAQLLGAELSFSPWQKGSFALASEIWQQDQINRLAMD